MEKLKIELKEQTKDMSQEETIEFLENKLLMLEFKDHWSSDDTKKADIIREILREDEENK